MNDFSSLSSNPGQDKKKMIYLEFINNKNCQIKTWVLNYGKSKDTYIERRPNSFNEEWYTQVKNTKKKNL